MVDQLPGYVLREPVGQGATAIVWRAEPAGTPGRLVAVKRLAGRPDPGALADLRREADALERLSHPSILRLLEVVEDGDGVALVLPFATGGSLAARIAANPDGLPAASVADLGARLAGALAAAHNLGLVHRDVKPTNVLFDAEGQPLLADFGTARLVHDRAGIAGTAEYLAPEVAGGEPPDARSDVYGLGITCYEALTGAPPYAGSTPAATLRAADRGHHVPLGEVIEAPDALIGAVEAAIARDPARRPETAARLAGLLDEARRELEAHGGAAPPPPPAAGPGGGAGVLGALPPDDGPRGRRRSRAVGGPAAERSDAAAGGAAPAAGASDGSEAPAADAGGAEGATAPGADGRAHERSPTQLFGPAPPRAASAAPDRRGIDRRLLVAAAALVLAVPLAVAWWLATGDETSEAPPAAADDPVREVLEEPERTPADLCEDVEPAEVDGAEVFPADVEARDCSVPVSWDGATLLVPRPDGTPVRYELDAEEGDRMVFGDWNCDGRETPALYRPSSGEVFLFEGFADDGEVTVRGEPSGVTDGEPRVVTDAEGCHRVEVEPA
jgi:hypothetical protein